MTETQGKTVTVQIRASELIEETENSIRNYPNTRSMDRKFYYDDQPDGVLEACTKRQGEFVRGRTYIDCYHVFNEIREVRHAEPPEKWQAKEMAKEIAESEDPNQEVVDDAWEECWSVWREEALSEVTGEEVTLPRGKKTIIVEIVEE